MQCTALALNQRADYFFVMRHTFAFLIPSKWQYSKRLH